MYNFRKERCSKVPVFKVWGGGGVIVFLFNTVFVLNLVQYSFWIGFIFVHNLKKGLSLVISFFSSSFDKFRCILLILSTLLFIGEMNSNVGPDPDETFKNFEAGKKKKF